MKNQKKYSSVCFGEFLWDVLPTQAKPGGAPVNVAYHLNKQGFESNLVSRVGKDEDGHKLLDILDSWGISREGCPVDDTYKTGIAEAEEGENQSMIYTIHQPVAWDNIQAGDQFTEKVKIADVFVFGSLASRSETSRETLFQLLEVAPYKVFDINLRAPFYSPEIIEQLLHKCDLLKMNKEELVELNNWFVGATTDKETINGIFEKFSISEIIVTDGDKGATYYSADGFEHFVTAPKVRVKDTVGSGDSFLAAFLANKIKGKSIDHAMRVAASLGSFVASSEGACPDYDPAEINLKAAKTEKEPA